MTTKRSTATDTNRVVSYLVRTACAVPAHVSQGERDLLRDLLAEDAADSGDQLTSFRPGGWWLGSEQISGVICWRLIRHCLISADGEESGGVQYWRVNGTGQRVVADPDYVPPMIRMAHHGEKGPFNE